MIGYLPLLYFHSALVAVEKFLPAGVQSRQSRKGAGDFRDLLSIEESSSFWLGTTRPKPEENKTSTMGVRSPNRATHLQWEGISAHG
jgi:hypothetical protein